MERKNTLNNVTGQLNDLAGLIAVAAGMLERIASTLRATQKVLSNELQPLNNTGPHVED